MIATEAEGQQVMDFEVGVIVAAVLASVVITDKGDSTHALCRRPLHPPISPS
jgi:hypothetical protein